MSPSQFCMSRVGTLLLLLSLVGLSSALKHHLKIRHDGRPAFFIENFGFEAGGEMHMEVKNFQLGSEQVVSEQEAGFLIKRSDTDASTIIEDSTQQEKSNCWERRKAMGELVQPDQEDFVFKKNIASGEEGFYNVYFVSCVASSVTFELKLDQFNVDSQNQRNYLSSGHSSLPTMYGVFTFVYLGCLFAWIFFFLRGNKATVNRVHHLMTVLIILKMLSLLFHSIEYHYIKTTGSGSGWSVAYYIFAGLKGVMLFVLIALIGTGWSFIKPFLSEKDKKLFLVVIPLQILDNIALIVIEETAPGSQQWLTWKNIFRLVDIVCCGAILIPIIWSIKHLREGLGIDGKAAANIKKLKLFRQFYLMVVAYIYFTRIIVYLVDATLPFRLVWLGGFFTELATLAFFCVTGYKFRPASDNPYFSLEEEVTTEIEMTTETK